MASGGELSRIGLAIFTLTSRNTSVPTLIFDEVDSGVGGATGEVVGRMMKQLGLTRQVLCVTHLPQVAACGDHHLKVEKVSDGIETVSYLRELNPTQRVEEIARMLEDSSSRENECGLQKKWLVQIVARNHSIILKDEFA